MPQEYRVNVFWEGPGWYAPVTEGFGYTTINWSMVATLDATRFEADVEARAMRHGTPRMVFDLRNAEKIGNVYEAVR